MFLGTISDNMHDKFKKNRQAKGSKIGSSILNEEKVYEIRRLRMTGKTYEELADIFNVSWYLIRSICKNRHWKHVALGEECKVYRKPLGNNLGNKTRYLLGSKNKTAKLTEDEVIQMRSLYEKGGHTFCSLSKIFNVSDSAVSAIIKRKTWKHLL